MRRWGSIVKQLCESEAVSVYNAGDRLHSSVMNAVNTSAPSWLLDIPVLYSNSTEAGRRRTAGGVGDHGEGDGQVRAARCRQRG